MAAAWQEQLVPGLWVPLGAAGAAAQPGTVRLCEQDTPCSSSTTALGLLRASLPCKVGLEVLTCRFSPSQSAKFSFCCRTGGTVQAGAAGHSQLRGGCGSCCHPPVSSRDCDRHTSGFRMCLSAVTPRCEGSLSCSSPPQCRAVTECAEGSTALSCYQFITHSLFCHLLKEPMDPHESPLGFFLFGLKAGGSTSSRLWVMPAGETLSPRNPAAEP